ncbi:GNAT family N-acetyltransferase [soil metagenome]
MPSSLRLAGPSDAGAVSEIYAPLVRETPVSFETVPPTPDEMAERIAKTLETHPWLVCEEAGEVRGYAYASPHRVRAAYVWSVDATVYVRPDARRSGMGRRLYVALFEILRHQGFLTAFAGITLPNPASVGLHEAMGFRPVGVYRNVGYKAGAWHDVGWWGLPLGEPEPDPAPPVPLREFGDLDAILSL